MPNRSDYDKSSLHVIYEAKDQKGKTIEHNMKVRFHEAARNPITKEVIVNLGGKPLDVAWAPYNTNIKLPSNQPSSLLLFG